MDSDLNGFCIAEKDTSDDRMITWIYPSMSSETRDAVLAQTSASNTMVSWVARVTSPPSWLYLHRLTVNPETTAMDPAVKELHVVLSSAQFNPEKYAALAKIMCVLYDKTADTKLQTQVYLDVLTTGQFDNPDTGKTLFSGVDFPPKLAKWH